MPSPPFLRLFSRGFAAKAKDADGVKRMISKGYTLNAKKKGVDVMHDPLFNKGTAFPEGERDRLNIRGLVPPRTISIEAQVSKIMMNISQQPDLLHQNLFLESLHNRNETLYHRVLVDHVKQLAPIVYTPVVGEACQQFGGQFTRARGLYFSAADKGHMSAMTYNWQQDEVDVIVITDGSRILGLGDLGCNGMGIPIGKLSLYCAVGGLAPHRVLPVMLDVGTNNEKLLDDPFYLGLQHKRIQGEEYFDLVDECLQALWGRFPKSLIQFEDFSSNHALDILNRYKHDQLCFNDDIQGTGATCLAGVLGALRVAAGGKPNPLSEQRIVVVGAGSAGIGVASSLKDGMRYEGSSESEAQSSFYVFDAHGLLGQGRQVDMPEQQEYVRTDMADKRSLVDVIAEVKPTVILGLSGVGGLFTEDVIREMSAGTPRPVVMPLSNPTSQAECTAEQAYTWSKGQAVVASGSPFEPVTIDGKAYITSQCNNMYIFPGVGLGAARIGAERVTDKMLYKAAMALAGMVTEEDMQAGKVFPAIEQIRDCSAKVACAVIEEAMESGINRNGLRERCGKKEMVEEFVMRSMYFPEYCPIVDHKID